MTQPTVARLGLRLKSAGEDTRIPSPSRGGPARARGQTGPDSSSLSRSLLLVVDNVQVKVIAQSTVTPVAYESHAMCRDAAQQTAGPSRLPGPAAINHPQPTS